MWTDKDLDGATVGIAYLGVVCNARSYAFGVSQRLSSAPAKYIVTAHEIGHNFGATHTDQASPVPADCGNTIMNSSVGSGATFCPFSHDEIASHVAASSGCLATASSSGCDINRDGQVNIVDTQLLINVILGAVCSGSCDVNGDGRVDVVDFQKLVNVILGLATCP
jgi:Metallo-peptidase family M12/Dockerin type I domain